jgi:hypothetical protein
VADTSHDEPSVKGLPTGAGSPEAITEQPELRFEHHPESKWLGDPFGLRLVAVALTARRRRKRGEAISPTPWLAIAMTATVAVALVVAVWWVASWFA